MRVCLHRIAPSKRLCPVSPELAGYSVRHWKKLLVLDKWTIAHCSGCAAEPVCCWEDYQIRGQVMHHTSSTEQNREPMAARVTIGQRIILISESRGVDGRRTETLISFHKSVAVTPLWSSKNNGLCLCPGKISWQSIKRLPTYFGRDQGNRLTGGHSHPHTSASDHS